MTTDSNTIGAAAAVGTVALPFRCHSPLDVLTAVASPLLSRDFGQRSPNAHDPLSRIVDAFVRWTAGPIAGAGSLDLSLGLGKRPHCILPERRCSAAHTEPWGIP